MCVCVCVCVCKVLNETKSFLILHKFKVLSGFQPDINLFTWLLNEIFNHVCEFFYIICDIILDNATWDINFVIVVVESPTNGLNHSP